MNGSSPAGRIRRRMPWTAAAIAGLLAVTACGAGAGARSGAGRARARRAGAGRGGQPGPGSGHAAGRAGGAGVPAGQPVRPAGVAEPVPRQGGDPGVHRFGVHHDLPADHPQHAGGQGPAGRRRGPGAADRDRREPEGHRGVRRDGLLPVPLHGQPVGLPDRLARAAARGMAGLPRLRADPGRADRPHPGAVRDRAARPGGEAVPDPDGVCQRRPAGADPGRGSGEPAARSPAARQPAVTGLHRRPCPHRARSARRPLPAGRSPSAPAAGACWCSSRPG